MGRFSGPLLQLRPRRSAWGGTVMRSPSATGGPSATADPSTVLPCGADEAFQLLLKARREIVRRQLPDRVLRAVHELPKAGVHVLLALVERSTEYDPQKGWTATGRSVLESELESVVDCSFADLQDGIESLRGRGIVLPDKGASDTEDGYRLSGAATPESTAPDPEAYDEFPGELWRVPVPNEVFELLPSLTGSGVRALLLMIRTGFHYDPKTGWVHGGRWKTVKELEHAAGGKPGATPRALRDGLRELERRGLVEIDRRGQSNHYWLRMEPVESSFTWLPTALLEQLGEHKTKALRVLLSIYRGTWGWTDRREYSGKTVHKRAVQLSSAELQARTGLSANSVRRAVEELAGDWIERARPAAGAAYVYRPLTSHFNRAEKSEGGTLPRERNSNSNTRTCGDSPPNRPNPPTEPRCSRGAGKARDESDPESPRTGTESDPRGRDSIPEGKEPLYERLTGAGMDHGPALWCLEHRAEWLIKASIGLLEESRKARPIPNPGGWLFSAIREVWAGSTSGRPPNRSRQESTEPGDLSEAVSSLFGARSEQDTDPAGGYSWEKARRILEENDLLKRIPDLSHWFEVVQTDTGRRYRPTDATRRIIE